MLLTLDLPGESKNTFRFLSETPLTVSGVDRGDRLLVILRLVGYRGWGLYQKLDFYPGKRLLFTGLQAGRVSNISRVSETARGTLCEDTVLHTRVPRASRLKHNA